MSKYLLSYSSDLITSIDEQSGSIIKLNNGIILYLREINKFLALVCIVRDYNFTRQGTVDYNFLCLHEAIHKIFSVRLAKKSNHLTYNTISEDDLDQVTNGTLTNGHSGQSSDGSTHQSNAQLTNYLLNTKFRKGLDQ